MKASKGASSAASLHLGKGLLMKISSFTTGLKITLNLSVFGKVESSNLLSLGIGQLLDVSLRLAEVLLGISKTSVFGIKLRLKLPDAGLHLCQGLLASLEGSLLSLIKASLGILDLGLKEFLVSLQHHGSLLLSSELISKSSSINHGTLGLVIRHLCLRCHLIKIMAKGIELLLTLGFSSIDCLVGAGLVRKCLIGISKLLLNHSPVPIRLLKESSCLLKGILVGIASPISSNEVVLSNGLGSGLLLKSGLDLSVSLAFSIGSIGMLKCCVEVKNISLKLLLHSKSFNFALGLSLQSHLHAFKSFSKVLFSCSKFLLLLGNSLLNLLSNLGQLKLASENLVFLLLKGSLCL